VTGSRFTVFSISSTRLDLCSFRAFTQSENISRTDTVIFHLSYRPVICHIDNVICHIDVVIFHIDHALFPIDTVILSSCGQDDH
jgi:hypothetical protein